MIEESSTYIVDHHKDREVSQIANKATNSARGIMTKLKLSYFGHIMRRWDSLEKTIMLEINMMQQGKRKIKY